jgi:DNA-binding NarL/FixJ family response regulator
MNARTDAARTEAAEEPMLRVVIADDLTEIRRGFRLLIDATPGLVVVGDAADGAEAVELARRARPDVILMDIRMPRVDGIEATRRITGDPMADHPPKILILTTFDLDEYVYGALAAGASGFLLKNVAPADLLRAIRVVAVGEALLAPSVTRRLIERFALSGTGPTRAEPGPGSRGTDTFLRRLTDREREVLALVARGCSNAEIGDRLYVGAATVKTHMNRLLSKLECRDRAQLVVFAYRSGFATGGHAGQWGLLPPGSV